MEVINFYLLFFHQLHAILFNFRSLKFFMFFFFFLLPFTKDMKGKRRKNKIEFLHYFSNYQYKQPLSANFISFLKLKKKRSQKRNIFTIWNFNHSFILFFIFFKLLIFLSHNDTAFEMVVVTHNHLIVSNNCFFFWKSKIVKIN